MTTQTRRDFTRWITCVDGVPVDHAVTDEDMTAGLNGRNEFRAVCGTRFLPAPMIEVSQRPCERCLLYLRAQRTMRGVQERMARQTPRRRIFRCGVRRRNR